MLSQEEKQLIRDAKNSGKSKEQAIAELSKYREEHPPKPSVITESSKPFVEDTPLSNKITEVLGLGGVTDVLSSSLARMGVVGPQTIQEGQKYIPAPTLGQVNGAGLQLASVTAPAAAAPLSGGLSLGADIAVGAGAGYLYDIGSDLASGKTVSESLTPGVGTAIGTIAPPLLKGTGAVFSSAKNAIVGTAKTATEALGGVVPQGIKQSTADLLDRVPRAIDKGRTYLSEQAARAERLQAATPEVRNAITSGLDDVLVTAVEKADDATKQAYKKMVEIAEKPRTGLQPSVRPESVAGETVSQQYKILDTQRRSIGSQLGDAVDKLSTKGAVDVLPAQRGMRQLLFSNGIKPDISGKLVFDGSSLTPKQQTLVQQLYDIATQSEAMTPRQVYNMDKLFSQLQREARFDGLDNLYFSTPEGDINAFRAFRNIFSNELDRIAPEIKPLNTQYAKLRNLQDDIEGSIVKRGNFESTRNVDPGEFAQTNLRRAFSDASSAADYRELAEKLDAFARANGYTGANPLDLAGFAQRLRQVYPDAVPETSAQGILGGGVKGVIEKVLKAGAPDVTDQQKALRELLGIKGNQALSDGLNALAAVPGTQSDDSNTQTTSAVTAGAGVIHSVKQGALEEYIKELEKSLDNALANGKSEKSPEVKQIMKSLLLAAKKLRKVI